MQYLMQRYHSHDLCQEFVDSLFKFLPPSETATYNWAMEMPGCKPDSISDQKPVILHCAAFAFGKKASVKGPPELSVALKLLEEVAVEGASAAGAGAIAA